MNRYNKNLANLIMKKQIKLIFSLLFILFTISAFSQVRNLRLGVSVEPLSLSYMSSNTPIITSKRNILCHSAFIKAEYYFSPFFAFASGVGITANQGGILQYSEGGDVWKDSDLVPATLHALPPDIELKSQIQYIEIPLALKMRTDEFGRYRVFFEVPRLTLGVTSKARGAVKSTTIDEENQNIYPSMSWVNLSYGIMGGIEYSITENISGIVGINWKQGFVDITDDSGVDAKITSGTFGIHAGVLF